MSKFGFYGSLLVISIIYVAGLPVNIMDIDAAQSASIAREMAETGDYLQVKHRGEDYLGHPPLLFWVSAFFFKIFGVHNWVYKIGPMLFMALGAISTYKLGHLLYNRLVGEVATLILLSSQAVFLLLQDVRTDTLLLSTTIFAVWQSVSWHNKKRWINLFGAALGVALAMLSKGPIGFLVPFCAVWFYLSGSGRLSEIFNWKNFLFPLLVLIFLMPMLYGLYTQFDMQPNKAVSIVQRSGMQMEKNVSGIAFFFWEQALGHLSGDHLSTSKGDPFFFIHSFLWSFMPWAMLFVIAFASRIRTVISAMSVEKKFPEMLTFFGFVIPFIILSLFGYKMPQYIFVLYPFTAILLAQWMVQISNESALIKKTVLLFQALVWLAFTVCGASLLFYVFDGASVSLIIIWILLSITALYWFIGGKVILVKLLFSGITTMLAFNLVMNTFFYAKLLNYQAGSEIAAYAKQHNIGSDELFFYYQFNFSLGLYMEDIIEMGNDEKAEERLREGQRFFAVVGDRHLTDLQNDFETKMVYNIKAHSATQLNFTFFNPETRAQTLHNVYLVELVEKSTDRENQ